MAAWALPVVAIGLKAAMPAYVARGLLGEGFEDPGDGAKKRFLMLLDDISAF